MKANKLILLLAVLAFSLSSCDQILDSNPSSDPSESEITEGLKKALDIGNEAAVGILNKKDGFYKDEAVKMLLPPEAKIIYDKKDNQYLKLAGVDKLIDDVILSMNRSAEDATSEALPIFKSAITDMTVVDGLSILQGTETAATEYLKSKTYMQLKDAFAPKIDESLDKVLVGDISTNKIWTSLTTKYNEVANSIPGQLAGLKPVDTQLSNFVTEKALDAMFLKVSEEEKKIRENPYQWAEAIITKVFGWVKG